ncbi:MAG TPA: hypothetical protein VHL11_21255, partial [Phototrophicaceae bacterium]|nr:hypothetical protein [Phototrophicaceae bacterium]
MKRTPARFLYGLLSLLLLGVLAGFQPGSALAQTDPVPLPAGGEQGAGTSPGLKPAPASNGEGSTDLLTNGAASEVIIFNDDFEGGLKPEVWSATSGVTTSIDDTGNQLVVLPGQQAITPLNLPALADYRLTVWFNLVGSEKFTRQTLDNSILPEAEASAFDLLIGTTTLHVSTTGLSVANGSPVLGGSAKTYAAGVWQQLDVTVSGNMLTAAVDNQVDLTYQIPVTAPSLGTNSQTSISFTLTGATGTTQIDDVRLVSFTKQLPGDTPDLSANPLTYNPARLSGELINLLKT